MKQHVIIWIVAVGLALGLGWMDYETTSWRVLMGIHTKTLNGFWIIQVLLIDIERIRQF